MSKALTLRNANLPISVGGFAALAQQARQYPMITAEEERELTLKYRFENDLEAAQQLILSHLRFVVKIARDFVGYGLPAEDLAQEGTIGLMKAVKRFDPDRGVRLVSFAVHWIRAEIYEYILRNWRIVKVATTKAQRKLFFKLRQSKKALGWMNDGQVQDVAQELEVKPEDVVEMEQRLSAHDQTFDPLYAGDSGDGEHHFAPEAYLPDERYEPVRQLEHWESSEQRSEAIQLAFDRLKPRSQEIVRRRWMQEPKATLQELAEEFGISIERVRQIEKDAFKAMAQHMEALEA